MAQAHKPSIGELLNTPAPAPEPPPVPPQPPAPAPPSAWPVPVPPSAGGGAGTITYETAALRRFAQTSDERAAAFGQTSREAQSLKLGWNAFGVMFGHLCQAAYDRQAQEVADGCQAGEQAMASIAEAMRANASNMDAANQAIEHTASQVQRQG